MKSIFLKILALVFITVSLWSCEKDETQVVSNVTPAGALNASATTLNLLQINAKNPAFTLSFAAPVVTGYSIPASSVIQFDIKGNNFSTAKEFVMGSKTTFTPTVHEFNAMLLALGAEIGKPVQIEARLKTGLAANSVTYSNIITFSATPYLASSWIYVPGAYQGWDPATADSLVSETSNDIYKGIIDFTPGNLGFKITAQKKWDVAYGDGGNGTISTTGPDFNAVTSGLKLLTVDIKAKTFSMVDVLHKWSILGDATPAGWDADTDLKFVNDGKGAWKITVNLKQGEFKFRANHDWAINLGGGANLTLSGANIAVTNPGNYTIALNVIYDKEDPTKVTGGTYTIVKN